MTTVSPRRPQLSPSFIAEQKRQRILNAVAKAIVKHGYAGTTVSTIVSTAQVSRSTFYEFFSGKEGAAIELAAEAGIKIEAEASSLDVLVIEHVALCRTADPGEPGSSQAQAIEVIRTFAEEKLDPLPASGDPLQHRLPPGRTALARRFVTANQTTRLVTGFATTVAANGYPIRIEDIAAAAAVSRRTFYEHFSEMRSLGAEMIGAASARLEKLYEANVPRGSALEAVVFEVVARRLVADDDSEGPADYAELAIKELSQIC